MSASFSLSTRALSIALSTAIGLAPMASFAQQAQPRQAPRPAQPAQPAQPPAGQAATGPTVVQVKPEPSQTTWTKVCGKDEAANKEICYTTRDFVSDQGQPVLAVAVYDVKGDPNKIVRFLMPLGLLLQPGIRFGVDTAQPTAGRYAICFPNGCFAEAQVKDDFINAMKKGNTLSVSVQNQGAREVSFAIPLTDFAKGFDGAAIDPKVLEQQQKQLQDELAKRQEELRQRLGGGGANAAPGTAPAPAPGAAPATPPKP
ncbi:MAG TPA: invasion associated locus B family protein [Bosea sp. (in: a-proteobacteria)]|uniref:invasion associated locus B family protein n=1 Tax=Bosea sp. (in: a-proteobacteria) TaxID=1871050 RepID=UPI002DDCA573|nr:invasion associated locus B family protein [Bosea sp. (in: a-proteobacteria)]HEV2556469.1 invasion associated locus B family protein [Bosea sp. (in: a-proteobacteria)]